MLLNELKGVKRFYKLREYQLEKLLRRFGIKLIGAGKYGRVFTHPSWNYVVKVFRDDLYYLTFVDFAIKNPNVHYPRFKKKALRMHNFTKRSQDVSPHLWLIKIEKLKELTDQNIKKFLDHRLESAMTAWYNKNHGDGKIATHRDKYYQMPLPDGRFEANTSWQDVFDQWPWVESLAEAWYRIHEATEGKEYGGAMDLHSGNFMQRDDGTIVITDPLWAGTNPYQEYREAIARETDAYADYDEYTPEISGPEYLNKKEASTDPKMVKQIASDFDLDIPF